MWGVGHFSHLSASQTAILWTYARLESIKSIMLQKQSMFTFERGIYREAGIRRRKAAENTVLKFCVVLHCNTWGDIQSVKHWERDLLQKELELMTQIGLGGLWYSLHHRTNRKWNIGLHCSRESAWLINYLLWFSNIWDGRTHLEQKRILKWCSGPGVRLATQA